jgi:hypothetical protein
MVAAGMFCFAYCRFGMRREETRRGAFVGRIGRKEGRKGKRKRKKRKAQCHDKHVDKPIAAAASQGSVIGLPRC